MLFYVVVAWLLAFCVIDHKGKISYWLMTVMMFLLMAYQTWNADMTAYKIMYSSISSISDLDVTDPAFSFIMYISKLLGLEYSGFLKLVTVIGLASLTIVLRKSSVCPALVLALYFIFTFYAESIQLRAFLSETLLYAMIVRLVQEEKFNLRAYLALLLTAFLLHSFSLIFILLLLVTRIRNRKLLLLVSIAVGIVLSLSFELLTRFPVAAIRNRVLIYLDEQRAEVSSRAWIFVLIYLSITAALLIFEKHEKDKEWKRKLNKLIGVHYIGLVSCILIILFSSNFYRMTRTIIVSDFIIMLNYLFKTKRLNSKKLMIVAAAVVIFFIGYEMYTQSWHRMLANNSILGFLS